MIFHSYYLAFRYMRSSPWRTLILVMGTTVALYLPTFTFLAADKIERQLLVRGETSPILIGHKGNEFDLTMNALYFRGQVKDTIPMKVKTQLDQKQYGLSIPLYIQHSASRIPVVGTSLDYFTPRELTVQAGRMFAVLGEVVVGATAASSFQLQPGDKIQTDSRNLYNISGSYPMLLNVVGVLEANGTADDMAVFTDVKTTWVLDGHLHGHNQVTKETSLNPDAEEGENMEATAAIFIFPEITDNNRNGFHLHGEIDELPISSVLVFPNDQKSHDQLLGDYGLHQTQQAVRPSLVIQTILDIVLNVQKAMSAYFFLVAFSTLSFFALVIGLSLRLRKRELALMKKIGGSRFVLSMMVAAEISIVIGLSVIGVTLLTWLSLIGVEALLQ